MLLFNAQKKQLLYIKKIIKFLDQLKLYIVHRLMLINSLSHVVLTYFVFLN